MPQPYELFHAYPIPNGNTWTLPSRLGDALAIAESLFGDRDAHWTILGVEMSDRAQPHVWYPGNRKAISVMLGIKAYHSESHAMYQLAHEVIHLLSPTGVKGTNVLEEGAAMWFASYYLRTRMNQPLWRPTLANYVAAEAAFAQLMNHDSQCVRNVRAIEQTFKHITSAQLIQASPKLDQALADLLTAPFDYTNGVNP